MDSATMTRETADVIITEYRAKVAAELNNAARVAAVYGREFADANVQQQCRTVCIMAAQMLGVPHAMVNLVTAATQENVVAYHNAVLTRDAPIPVDESYCQHVIGTGRPFQVDDGRGHHLVCNMRFTVEGVVVSYLGVPIINHVGLIVGVLCVYDSTAREWGVGDVDMLARLAAVISRAITAVAGLAE